MRGKIICSSKVFEWQSANYDVLQSGVPKRDSMNVNTQVNNTFVVFSLPDNYSDSGCYFSCPVQLGEYSCEKSEYR